MTRLAFALVMTSLTLTIGCRAVEKNFCSSFEQGSLARCTEDCIRIAHADLAKPEGRDKCTKGCEAALVDNEPFKTRCSRPPTTAPDRAYCETFEKTFRRTCASECSLPPEKESLRPTCKRECIRELPLGAQYTKRCGVD